MADTTRIDWIGSTPDLAHLARLRERVLSGFAFEDDDLAAIVEPLTEVLMGEDFVVSDLRRVGSPLVHVEPGFERLTGYAPEVAVGRDLGFLLLNDTEQDAVREARDAVRDGRATSVTVRNYRADGALFWCEQRHYPVRDARGRVGHLVTVLREVTDQVNARSAEAAALEARLPGDADHGWFTYGGLIDARGRLRVTYTSGAVRAVLDMEPEAAVPDGWWHVAAEKDRALLDERGAALRAQGGSRRDRYRIRARGRMRTVEDFVSVTWVAAEAGLVAVHGVVRDVTETGERLRSTLLGVDASTGLPTEEVVTDRLDVATRRARRNRRRVAYLAVSLDHFDFVHSNMNPQRGERIVREAARRMRRALRRSDTLARVGPADFVVILDDLTDAEGALPVVEKLLAWVARPFDDGQLRVELSASVGVAMGEGDARDRSLPDEARVALERARADGGGRFAFYAPSTDADMRARRALELDLRGGFADSQFELHYQPRVRLAGGDVTGVEALVRWRHPERGLLLPEHFLPQVQRAQLGDALFELVLDRALRQSAAWIRAGGPTRVGINVTGDDLARPDLVAFVARSLRRLDVPPPLLELELHEGLHRQALEEAVDRLAELRRLGVRISLDDFGIGDTNLTLLRDLPLDSIKIDRSFVQRIGVQLSQGEQADQELLRAMVGLGRGLGLVVVAEGVETEFQRARLHAFACEEAQGYLFAPPSPVAA